LEICCNGKRGGYDLELYGSQEKRKEAAAVAVYHSGGGYVFGGGGVLYAVAVVCLAV